VSGVDNFNVVIDGAALSIEFSPVVKVKVEYNDWSVPERQTAQGLAAHAHPLRINGQIACGEPSTFML
jgi:hypothetical protein